VDVVDLPAQMARRCVPALISPGKDLTRKAAGGECDASLMAFDGAAEYYGTATGQQGSATTTNGNIC